MSVTELENEIESNLIAAHKYSNPGIFKPMNPVFRVIRKTFFFLIKMYTNYQIPFNYKILSSINKVYHYQLFLDSEREEKEVNYKKKIKELESRIKLLENKLKSIR